MSALNMPEGQAAPTGLALEVQIGSWLKQREWKLVVAESCTGGLIGHRVTNIAGSSDYYLGSIVAYAYEAKERLLGVSHETLARYGAVSSQVVLEMARGVRQSLAGDFPLDHLVGVSVSGIAGPGGGLPEKPVGTVWVGLSGPGLERAWKFLFHGNRIENKELAADKTLHILLDYLEGKVA